MNRQRTIWWALSAVVVVVMAAVSGTGVVTWLMQQNHTLRSSYAVTAIKSVELNTGPAQVQVFPSTDGTASVTQNLRWVFSKPMVTERLDPATGVLHVDASCESAKPLGGMGCSVGLEVAVPAAVPVSIDGGSGQVTLTSMTGPVTARGGSGEFDLENLSGALDVEVGSGQITGSDLHSSQVTARAGSGQIDLDFALPPSSVTAEVTSGEVQVALPRGRQYQVTTSVVSGDTSVDPGLASTSATGSVNVSVTSGDAEVRYR